MKGVGTAATMLAAICCAGPLEADCSDSLSLVNALPATVSAEERKKVEAAIGSAVYEIACSRIAAGMSLLADRSQVAAVSIGYLALTDQAVIFMRTLIPVLRRRDVTTLGSFDEITYVIAPSPQSGPNITFELAVKERPSSVTVARGRNGDAFLEALRMRVIAACGTGAIVTAVGVTCP
jgi:hypothetical protein